jgi:hypothetical protein
MQSQLPLEYSLIYGSSCFLGALVGVIMVNSMVRRTGATWLVVRLSTADLALLRLAG